jgi:SAM-dependent methyltransferase
MRNFLNQVRLLPRLAAGFFSRSHCFACGKNSILIREKRLWPELIAQWELSAEWTRWFDEREGHRCHRCNCPQRSRQLAQAIVEATNEVAGFRAASLAELCKDARFRALQIAEINSAGSLHRFLTQLPNLRYSEYGSTRTGVPSEDLMALTYRDSTFDIVLTSETLEHLPDVDRALREIHRVLKPCGFHVFTTPVVWDRAQTRERARIENGKVIHLLPPSYHRSAATRTSDLLVFNEFGADFLPRCEAAGFDVRLLRAERNPALVTFLARKK